MDSFLPKSHPKTYCKRLLFSNIPLVIKLNKDGTTVSIHMAHSGNINSKLSIDFVEKHLIKIADLHKIKNDYVLWPKKCLSQDENFLKLTINRNPNNDDEDDSFATIEIKVEDETLNNKTIQSYKKVTKIELNKNDEDFGIGKLEIK